MALDAAPAARGATCPLLIADGLIATTAILERVLRDAYGDVQVVTSDAMLGVPTNDRLIFISRLCHPRFTWFVDYFRARSIPYVYVLDDNFFELTVDYDPYNGAFFSHPDVHASLTQFLQGAAAVWLMSKPLEAYLLKRLPNLVTQFIDAPVDVLRFDRAALANAPAKRDRFVVGYPSSRRLNVADLISDVVQRSVARWGDSIQFEFIGWCPERIAEHPNVTVFPAVGDYEAFLQLMASRHWDAAIAPLGASAFENAKTSLKYREYGAARIPAVYSRCPLFEACVVEGVTGLLAEDDAEDWLRQIEKLMQDPALRASITREARTHIDRTHGQAVIASRVRETFAAILSSEPAQ
jgi:glycosyltransferase involved in cell wall biosynthesis